MKAIFSIFIFWLGIVRTLQEGLPNGIKCKSIEKSPGVYNKQDSVSSFQQFILYNTIL